MKYVTAKEFADMIGCAHATLGTWRMRGNHGIPKPDKLTQSTLNGSGKPAPLWEYSKAKKAAESITYKKRGINLKKPIMKLMAEGCSRLEISKKLKVTVSAIDNYFYRNKIKHPKKPKPPRIKPNQGTFGEILKGMANLSINEVAS